MVELPTNTPTLPPRRLDAGMRAFSSASQVNSSAIRCCGSRLSASIFDSAKNSASKPLMSLRYPPRVRALRIRSASRGSSMNSAQRSSGRSVMASRPSSSASHIASGVFISPGKRVANPTIAMSSTPSSRVQSSSPSAASSSGSPSTITVASDSMVGWRNATVAVSVTPVRSSISLAIATASREDNPSSTIGVDSLIASGDCPVALATQLRSHSRICGTEISVRGALNSPSGARTMWSGCCASCCTSGSAPSVSDMGPSAAVTPRRGRHSQPSRSAGCRRGTPSGRHAGRSCRWTYAGLHRPGSATRRAP